MEKIRVSVLLPEAEYQRLRQLADRDERIANQQATFLLRRAIDEAIRAAEKQQEAAIA